MACVYLIGVDAQALEMSRQPVAGLGLSKTLCLRPSLATSAVNLRRLFQGLGACKSEKRRFSGETPSDPILFSALFCLQGPCSLRGLALFTDRTDGRIDG
jgi:hypothetical protein